MNPEKSISRICVAARVIAVLMVVSAHITIRNPRLSTLYNAIGSTGTVVFILMAGYFYKPKSFQKLLSDKARTVVIPWLALGTVVWAWNSFLAEMPFKIGDWMKWIVGYKTYLYYVPVIMVLYLLFRRVNSKLIMFAAIGLNLLSIVLTSIGMQTEIHIMGIRLTNYQNVFNWIGFFATGRLLSRIDKKKLLNALLKSRIPAIIICAFSTIVVTKFEIEIGYFSKIGWIYELISAWGIFSICTFSVMQSSFISSISERSYAIYLLHMAFIGVISKLCNMNILLMPAANVIGLLLTYAVIRMGEYIANWLGLSKVYNCVIGLRNWKRVY